MAHHSPRLEDVVLTRRELLGRSGTGFGALALGALLSESGLLDSAARAGADAGVRAAEISSTHPLFPKSPPSRARARRVVPLFMTGGPPHVDTFAPKPLLARHHGKPVPTNLPTERKTGAAFRSPYKFRKYGQS